jgi:hypothetical protein
MVVSKLNLIILAVAVGGVLWIEHANRMKIEMPTPAELAGAKPAICPENESVPFSADCMMLIQGGAGSDVHLRVNAADVESAESPELP